MVAPWCVQMSEYAANWVLAMRTAPTGTAVPPSTRATPPTCARAGNCARSTTRFTLPVGCGPGCCGWDGVGMLATPTLRMPVVASKETGKDTRDDVG